MTTTQETDGVQLKEWAKIHQPVKGMAYTDDYWDQINFVQGTIASLLAKTYGEFLVIQSSMRVISEHIFSMSMRLPVFCVELADGTVFTMRYNFRDWKVSVNSPRDVEADFMGLFKPDERIREVHCEGFPRGLVFGPYTENKRQFTVELPSGNYRIFTFFWIFAHQVLGNQNKEGGGT